MAEDNPPRSDLVTIQWSRRRKADKEVKDPDLEEVEVAAMVAVAVVELLQTLAELTLVPSLEL
jgi:hypothetical protein